MALNRLYGFNKEAVTKYSNNLENLLIEDKFDLYQIYNCDETCITTAHKPVKVVAPTGKHCVINDKRGKWYNPHCLMCFKCNCAFCATHDDFKRKNKKASLTDHAPPGTIEGCSENVWVNTKLFLVYIKHFVKHVKCSIANPILIFDGHKSQS